MKEQYRIHDYASVNWTVIYIIVQPLDRVGKVFTLLLLTQNLLLEVPFDSEGFGVCVFL